MAFWQHNETDPSLRTATINVFSKADGSKAPADTDLSGTLMIRHGLTWADAAGTLTNVGYDGTWEYVATENEGNVDTNEIELRIVSADWTGQQFVGMILGATSGAGTLIFATPVGSLDPDPDVARWTPIVLTIAIPSGFSVVIVALLQDAGLDPAVLTHVAYADELGGFQPMFEDKSTVTVDGLNTTFSVLPNGGWTRPNVTIVPYIAYECELTGDSGGGAGSLISSTTQGQLGPTPDTARKAPIVVRYVTPANMSLVAIAMIGNDTYFPIVMYADELSGLQTLFSPPEDLPNVPASTLTVTGTISAGRNITANWLPIGGWIREAVQILSYVAFESTP